MCSLYSSLWFVLFLTCRLGKYTKDSKGIGKRTGAGVQWCFGSKGIYIWRAHGGVSHKIWFSGIHARSEVVYGLGSELNPTMSTMLTDDSTVMLNRDQRHR